MIEVGVTDRGEIVDMPRRAMDSDLLVYVNINLVASWTVSHKSVPVGLLALVRWPTTTPAHTLYNLEVPHGPASLAIPAPADAEAALWPSTSR